MLSASRLSLARLSIVFGTSILTATHGSPINIMDDDTVDVGSAEFWTRFCVIIGLVLMGGVFAGKYILGLDETNLQVLMVSGTEAEKKNAHKVYKLLERGKHWVLVTLLLSNVIVNETLPIILDSVFGGGWQAVVISTALIVIFGEVIPQSICVRHGLAIGAKTSDMVLGLMYIMYPIAYPTALLLDYFLGESHGTVYKKAGLKTLVSLHKAVDENGDVDALTDDEVTIIGAVLDLRAKPVSKIMTPIADCFTLPVDAILDEKVMDQIVSAGYSRIPVHSPGSKSNFVGMLLVKQLIKYDPEDAEPVSSFHISTLPETGPDTSCLDILNFFQEGRSHMALVSNDPGGETGVLGVITLEDVIEELIGEEIIDETDVYVDVHQKIKVVRRPANKTNIRLFPFLASRRRASKDVIKNDKIVTSKQPLQNGSISNPKDSQGIETRIKGYGAVTNGCLEAESAAMGSAGESQPLIDTSNHS